MSLADNLKLAEQAVSYVKRSGILASNKVQDRIKAAGGIDQVISAGGYDSTANDGVTAVRAGVRPTYTIDGLRKVADSAARNKFGNCWEQAVMATVFLYDRGAQPVDLMVFGTAGYDHVWTCIGLAPTWEAHNLRTWGAEAVWCDSWQGDGVAFAIDDLVKGKVRNLNAIYKCNTKERVEQGSAQSLFRH